MRTNTGRERRNGEGDSNFLFESLRINLFCFWIRAFFPAPYLPHENKSSEGMSQPRESLMTKKMKSCQFKRGVLTNGRNSLQTWFLRVWLVQRPSKGCHGADRGVVFQVKLDQCAHRNFPMSCWKEHTLVESIKDSASHHKRLTASTKKIAQRRIRCQNPWWKWRQPCFLHVNEVSIPSGAPKKSHPYK